jgi:hypothetical protein
MDFIVHEFEREYADGKRMPDIRKFVNKYCIQGGEHARHKRAQLAERERIIDKKIRLLEYLLGGADDRAPR